MISRISPGASRHPAKSPPQVDSTGELIESSANSRDLVWEPAEFDLRNGATVPLDVPTLAQWEAGSHVTDWKTKKGNTLTITSQNYQWLGWAYPGISGQGVCY